LAPQVVVAWVLAPQGLAAAWVLAPRVVAPQAVAPQAVTHWKREQVVLVMAVSQPVADGEIVVEKRQTDE
jgi:hypothetical protein